jgi:hypothetical protein
MLVKRINQRIKGGVEVVIEFLSNARITELQEVHILLYCSQYLLDKRQEVGKQRYM